MDSLNATDQAVLGTIFDPLQALDLEAISGIEDSEAEDRVLGEEARRLLRKGISYAESQRYEDAFRYLDEALDKAPRSPTILNDRAQALRLAGRNEEALRDLDEAVELGGGRGKAGVRALCQRALLYRLLGREDDARNDFDKAAKRGSRFARAQLVLLNPYAAMCNAMLQKIIAPSNF